MRLLEVDVPAVDCVRFVVAAPVDDCVRLLVEVEVDVCVRFVVVPVVAGVRVAEVELEEAA